MFNHLKIAACILVAAAVFLTTGCNIQPAHPNQLNPFDGATYDSLTLAHGALTSVRVQVSTTYPKYTPLFDQAAAAYSTAFSAYSLYRANPTNQAQVSVAIDNLSVAIIALENTFQSDLPVSATAVYHLRHKAQVMRKAFGPAITVSEILTELEVAAAIAETIPGAQPYAALAQMIIEATQKALTAESASSGQPIDLSIIQPISPVS